MANLRFASSNQFDIPDLHPSKMARQLDAPTHAWRGKGAKKLVANTSLWHFYTAEKNFNAFRSKGDPSPVCETPAFACVEPNFGLGEDTPRAIALSTIYWKRYCSRYWQTEGKMIVVDLHVPEPFIQLNLIGVPRGSTAYATRGTYGDNYVRAKKDEIRRRLDLDLATAQAHAETDDIQFLVYFGGTIAQAWAKENGAVWQPNYRETQIKK